MIISRSIHVAANGIILKMNSCSIMPTLGGRLLHGRHCAHCSYFHLVAHSILITALWSVPYLQMRKLSHRHTLPKVTWLRSSRWGLEPMHSGSRPGLSHDTTSDIFPLRPLEKGSYIKKPDLDSSLFTIPKFYDLKKYSVSASAVVQAAASGASPPQSPHRSGFTSDSEPKDFFLTSYHVLSVQGPQFCHL